MTRVDVRASLVAGLVLAVASLLTTAIVVGLSGDPDNIAWLLVFPVVGLVFLVAGAATAMRVGPLESLGAVVVVVGVTAIVQVGTDWDGRWLSNVWSGAAVLGLLPVALVRALARSIGSTTGR